MHTCPLATPGTPPVPHVGGPVLPPGAPTVLIGGQPAARVTDMCVCVGPPDAIAKGSPTVLIGGLMAARVGDLTVHGGVITVGLPTVMIGEVGMASPPAPPGPPAPGTRLNVAGGASGGGGGGGAAAKQKAIDDAIAIIEKSKWASTPEGKKVLAKIKQLNKDGKIVYKKVPAGTMGQWDGSQIIIPEGTTDPDFIASSVLVHEGTHALNEDEFPASKTKLTIDEEMRTNTNELDLYEQQRAGGYRNAELERRRSSRAKGKLRDDVRGRYPGAPEHL
jgi:uncharacterized Zn-binding protein involved in type VI secretion